MNKIIILGFLFLSVTSLYLAYLDFTSLVKPTISAFQGLALMSLILFFILIFFIQEHEIKNLKHKNPSLTFDYFNECMLGFKNYNNLSVEEKLLLFHIVKDHLDEDKN